MATGPQQKRKELREKRLKAEAAAQNSDRRQNLVKIIGIAVVLAVVAIVVAVVVSQKGSDSPSKGSGDIDKLLSGIPQNGTVLGDPKAKVTLYEFGDLQCPICEQYSTAALPDIISGPIKAGKANFDFKQWAILGEDSATAARAALAAAEQDRYWQFIENFYANQGIENTGYVTDDFLTEIAEKAGVPDMDKWNTDRESQKVDNEIAKIDEQAVNLGLSGTPSFALQVGDGELKVIQTTSADSAADQITKAINQAQSGN